MLMKTLELQSISIFAQTENMISKIQGTMEFMFSKES